MNVFIGWQRGKAEGVGRGFAKKRDVDRIQRGDGDSEAAIAGVLSMGDFVFDEVFLIETKYKAAQTSGPIFCLEKQMERCRIAQIAFIMRFLICLLLTGSSLWAAPDPVALYQFDEENGAKIEDRSDVQPDGFSDHRSQGGEARRGWIAGGEADLDPQ